MSGTVIFLSSVQLASRIWPWTGCFVAGCDCNSRGMNGFAFGLSPGFSRFFGTLPFPAVPPADIFSVFCEAGLASSSAGLVRAVRLTLILLILTVSFWDVCS